MDDFENAYAAWRGLPFPPGSSDDSLDELHADLALADTWVAESVVPFVEQNLHQPAKLDVVAELHELRSRAMALSLDPAFKDEVLLDSYRDYVDILIRVYQGFLARRENA